MPPVTPREGAPGGCDVPETDGGGEGEGKEGEGDATAPLERTGSAGQNWRGGGPKIKASLAGLYTIERFLFLSLSAFGCGCDR